MALLALVAMAAMSVQGEASLLGRQLLRSRHHKFFNIPRKTSEDTSSSSSSSSSDDDDDSSSSSSKTDESAPQPEPLPRDQWSRKTRDGRDYVDERYFNLKK